MAGLRVLSRNKVVQSKKLVGFFLTLWKDSVERMRSGVRNPTGVVPHTHTHSRAQNVKEKLKKFQKRFSRAPSRAGEAGPPQQRTKRTTWSTTPPHAKSPNNTRLSCVLVFFSQSTTIHIKRHHVGS